MENHGWSDIVIYLVRGTATERLGRSARSTPRPSSFPTAGSASATTSASAPIPIGAVRAFTSENLLVQPGQWIKWTLESDLTRSFLAVY